MLNAIQKAAIRHLTAKHFSPPETRMSDKEWCAVVGIVPKTIQRWKLDAEFASTLEASIKEMEESTDPFASCARSYALEQMIVEYGNKKNTGSEKRKWLKLIIENTEHVADQGEVVRYDDLSDEDLANLALARGVTPAGMTQDQLRKIAKGEPCFTSPSVSSAPPSESSSESERAISDSASDTPPE